MTRHSTATRLIAAAILAAVLWLTLRPADTTATDITPWWCLACGPAGSADLFQNLLLLLPLGIALRWGGWRGRGAVATLVAIPLAIEVAQALLATGRDAALGDVVANATGGMAGWWLGGLGRRLLLPDAKMSGWAAPIGLGLFVAQLVATASLAGPSLDGPEPWRLRLAPVTAERPTYRGAIVSVALGGEPILTPSPRPAQPPRDDADALDVAFLWASPPRDELVPIIRLDDARHWAIATVDARGDAIGVTLRTHAGRLRWRTPTWLVALPRPRAAGDTVRVTLEHRPGTLAASVTIGAARESLTVRYGAQHGWALINPFTPVHRSAEAWQWWTLAWLFGWGVLLGWSARGARRRVAWWGASLLALLGVSAVSGAGATWLELAALGIGWWVWPVSSAGSRRSPGGA